MLRSMVRARGGAAIRAGAGCRQVDGATDANSGSLLATDTTVHKMSFSTTLAGTAAVWEQYRVPREAVQPRAMLASDGAARRGRQAQSSSRSRLPAALDQ